MSFDVCDVTGLPLIMLQFEKAKETLQRLFLLCALPPCTLVRTEVFFFFFRVLSCTENTNCIAFLEVNVHISGLMCSPKMAKVTVLGILYYEEAQDECCSQRTSHNPSLMNKRHTLGTSAE